jgi:hypothetical protein
MRRTLTVLALAALAAALAAVPLASAPRGKPEPPDFEVVVIHGLWDGDAKFQPYFRDDSGVVWRLCFPSRGVQDVMLGPLDSTVHARATGYVASGGGTQYLFVTSLTAD